MSLPGLARDDIKCWVCLGTPDDLPPNGSDYNWRRPCTCTLVAHEACLLDWISVENDEKPCPQCGRMIRAEGSKNPILKIRNQVQQFVLFNARTLFRLKLYLDYGMIFYGTLYMYGSRAILAMCSRRQALMLLTVPNVASGTMTAAVAVQVLRRFVGIPAIPIYLILSRAESARFRGFFRISCLLFADIRNGMKFGTMDSTFMLLPVLWELHSAASAYLIKPLQAKFDLEAQAGTSRDIEGINANRNNNINNNNREIEDINNIGQQNRINEHIPVNNMNNDLEIEQRDAVAIGINDGEFVMMVGNRDVTFDVVGALLLPWLSSFTTAAIERLIPAFRRYIPDKFTRSVLGGCLVVLVKDIFNIYCSYLKARRSPRRRRIKNADGSDSIDSILKST
ncbi:hypothetical protein V1511DRAFT_487054 [Dipodascopsis uninucleata]